jgi:hypothetical protein
MSEQSQLHRELGVLTPDATNPPARGLALEENNTRDLRHRLVEHAGFARGREVIALRSTRVSSRVNHEQRQKGRRNIGTWSRHCTGGYGLFYSPAIAVSQAQNRNRRPPCGHARGRSFRKIRPLRRLSNSEPTRNASDRPIPGHRQRAATTLRAGSAWLARRGLKGAAGAYRFSVAATDRAPFRRPWSAAPHGRGTRSGRRAQHQWDDPAQSAPLYRRQATVGCDPTARRTPRHALHPGAGGSVSPAGAAGPPPAKAGSARRNRQSAREARGRLPIAAADVMLVDPASDQGEARNASRHCGIWPARSEREWRETEQQVPRARS